MLLCNPPHPSHPHPKVLTVEIPTWKSELGVKLWADSTSDHTQLQTRELGGRENAPGLSHPQQRKEQRGRPAEDGLPPPGEWPPLTWTRFPQNPARTCSSQLRGTPPPARAPKGQGERPALTRSEQRGAWEKEFQSPKQFSF